MKDFFSTAIGRLRIAGILEGISLIILLCIGVPLKYLMEIPGIVKFMGPVHGALFLLFIFLFIGVATEHNWKGKTLLKIILACFIPFGTFYIDRTILSKAHRHTKAISRTENN
ncbi:DUF3817 domain-containing protein [Aquimarina addita]|uniref:DUF3817 domain-containing protein n=1 Tax=Aquimarina addita TaxID=870485 RepID=A0ABP6UTR8_9FLAO